MDHPPITIVVARAQTLEGRLELPIDLEPGAAGEPLVVAARERERRVGVARQAREEGVERAALVELVEKHGAQAPEHIKALTASLAEAVHAARKEIA